MDIKDNVSIFKDFFTLVKDIFVGVLIAALLLWPTRLNDKLKAAGFTTGNFGVLSWSAQSTAQNVSQAKQDVQDGTTGLEALANDPKYAKDPRVKDILGKLKTSEANITSADAMLKNTVAQQQSATQQQSPTTAPPTEGWIMLGRIDQDKKQWVTENVNLAGATAYSLAVGQELELSQSVYLRALSSPGQRATGAILSVLPAGSKVKVLELDDQSSHALAGGWFVWARVSSQKTP
jgi:hypothetical protein